MSLPAGFRHTHLLPEKRTARVLAEAFFINTHGLILVFDSRVFLKNLEICYSDPLSIDPSWLCLLNLVFAIGLMLATPPIGSEDASIIEQLRSKDHDLAEVFYLNAKGLADPSAGFEDAGFWSIQALFLMALYMLTRSKRNSAWAFFGMAVRSAFALGLHREETMIIFSRDDQQARRSLWRSLYIMDRYLACSLGRPTTISEDDCSGTTLAASGNSTLHNGLETTQTNEDGLDASVRSCAGIGVILKRVYQQRKISTRVAQEIADLCKTWPKALAPKLHGRQATGANAREGIAILHVNLLYCHSIILLSRPFFLSIMNQEMQKDLSGLFGRPSSQNHLRMRKFAEACVIASSHTIVLVQNAYEAGYLPRRNPVVIYFLFAAALIVLSNEFGLRSTDSSADQSIANAIGMMSYCAKTDPQARRFLYILETFRDVVHQRDALSVQTQEQVYSTGSMGENLPGTLITPVGEEPQIHPYVASSTSQRQAEPLQEQANAFEDGPPGSNFYSRS